MIKAIKYLKLIKYFINMNTGMFIGIPNWKTCVQMTKIILVHPKCEIILVLFNCLFVQYHDMDIGLLSIASCEVIALILLCIVS